MEAKLNRPDRLTKKFCDRDDPYRLTSDCGNTGEINTSTSTNARHTHAHKRLGS